MNKVLVSLVSAQTIPNIEFIKEKQNEVNQFLFISTNAMERFGNRAWIIDTVGMADDLILEPIIVNEFSFEDIEEKLSKRINDEDEYMVNLTGGTKVMSLAVFEFFKSINSKMFYLTGRGEYIKVHPGRKKSTFNLEAKISLEEYLKAYGFEIADKSSPFRDRETSKSMLQYFLHSFSKELDVPVLEALREQRKKGKKNTTFENVKGLADFLTRVKYIPAQKTKLNKYEVRYLTGDWFEDYFYFFLLDNFEIKESELGLSWIVSKNDTTNEFDVLLMRNNKLYLFECKTSIYIDTDESQTFIGETIYKSDSLRNKFGLFTQTTVVTLSDLTNSRLKKHIERAEVSRVKLIGKNAFKDEGQLLKALKNV